MQMSFIASKAARCGVVALLVFPPLGLAGCGAVVGGAAGGLAGHQIGSGKGKTAAR